MPFLPSEKKSSTSAYFIHEFFLSKTENCRQKERLCPFFVNYNGFHASRYGSLDDKTKGALARLTDVAVDIKPCYPLAGEDCEQARSF